MTKIQFLTTAQGDYVGFRAEGHCGFAARGEDIVCAGVSALIQTTVLALERLAGVDLKIGTDKKSGLIACRIIGNPDGERLAKAKLLLETMYLGLSEMAKEYRPYVKVSIKEVE